MALWQESDPDWDQVGGVDPEPEAEPDPSVLPEAALDEIVRLLAEIFHSRYRLALDAPALARLREEAPAIKLSLEARQRAAVWIDHLLEGHGLETVIYLSEVKAWLALGEEKPQPGKVPPEACPGCGEPLAGQWSCQACRLEIENPWQLKQQGLASITSIAHLPYHHVLMGDPERKRMLFFNCQSRTVVWAIESAQLKAAAPAAALMLPERHVLVCDRDAGRVFECSLFGELLWEYETGQGVSPLKQPAKATYYRQGSEDCFLIADTGNHRVLMVNRRQQIRWQYGHLGRPGKGVGQLHSPSDIQLTPEGHVLICDSGNRRVLELNFQSHKILWQSPASLGLKRPVFAERLANGNLLLVDAGSFKVIELDPEDDIVAECRYYTEQLDLRLCMDRPIQLIRRENRNLLLCDRQRVIEIDFSNKQIVWISTLSDLGYAYQTDITQSLADRPSFVHAVAKADTLPDQRLRLLRSLRRTRLFKGAPEGFCKSLIPYLKPVAFMAGESLVQADETEEAMYILEAGQVELLREAEGVVAILEAGDVFGEMALVTAGPSPFTVRALSDGTCCRLSKWTVEKALKAFPELERRMQDLVDFRSRLTQLRTQRHLDAEQAANHLQASNHLQTLIQAQQARLATIRKRLEKTQGSPLIVFRPLWRLLYTRLEQQLIHEGLRAQIHCYELHLYTPGRRLMSQDQASHAISALEAIGTVIKLHPTAQALMAGRCSDSLAITVLTDHSRAQVIEDLGPLNGLMLAQMIEVMF